MKWCLKRQSRWQQLLILILFRFSHALAPLSDESIRCIEEGITSCFSRGPLLGYSMIHSRIRIDPKQCLWDAQTPPAIIQSAVISCLSSGLRKNAIQLLEPIMKYEASVSNNAMGNVLSDLTGSRRFGAV